VNEQIKELVKQAVTRFDLDMDGEMEPNEIGDWVMVDDLEKFAELIILESNYWIHRRIGPKTALDFLEHFGVEE
jgi:hypothetical protein